VATLGASKYAYAEATWTQTLPDWIGANIRMLEFFGAVPVLWMPDFVAGNKIRIMFPSPLCAA
jgi:transposase